MIRVCFTDKILDDFTTPVACICTTFNPDLQYKAYLCVNVYIQYNTMHVCYMYYTMIIIIHVIVVLYTIHIYIYIYVYINMHPIHMRFILVFSLYFSDL